MIPEKFIGIIDDYGIDIMYRLETANIVVMDTRIRLNSHRNPKLWAGCVSEEEITKALTLGMPGVIFLENASRINQATPDITENTSDNILEF